MHYVASDTNLPATFRDYVTVLQQKLDHEADGDMDRVLRSVIALVLDVGTLHTIALPKINVNLATVDEMTSAKLTSLGKETAQAIVDFRQNKGPITDIVSASREIKGLCKVVALNRGKVSLQGPAVEDVQFSKKKRGVKDLRSTLQKIMFSQELVRLAKLPTVQQFVKGRWDTVMQDNNVKVGVPIQPGEVVPEMGFDCRTVPGSKRVRKHASRPLFNPITGLPFWMLVTHTQTNKHTHQHTQAHTKQLAA
jgi:hypothetical protein